MNYTVVWLPSAENDLATLWVQADDRSAVSTAADAMDEALRRDPLSLGESRSENSRIFIDPPLALLFDVSEADQRVTVWAVMQWGTGSSLA